MDIRRFGTGYIPDVRDARDYLAMAAVPVEPATVMYDMFMLPPRNQGSEGTCVSFAGSGLKEFYDNRQRNSTDYFSPRYLYSMCKRLDGIPNEEGTYPRIAMKVMQDYGVAYESDWPYQAHQGNNPVDWELLHEHAKTQKIMTYARLRSTQDMISNLVLNGPFMIGVVVTDGFYTREAIETGFINPDIVPDTNSGGHALCVVGYDHLKDQFKVRNSWGLDYGDNGYNWMTRGWMDQYCTDAWSLVDDTAIDAGLVIIRPVVPDPVLPDPVEPVTPDPVVPHPVVPTPPSGCATVLLSSLFKLFK